MKIVLTGADGLVARHVHCTLHTLAAYRDNINPINRTQFNNPHDLGVALQDSDVVIHCAGINRSTPEQLENGNRLIAEQLVNTLELLGSTPHIFYTNTTHSERDDPYGRGKSAANMVFFKWADKHHAKYTELILPHIFGEGGKPNYNSAIHTFCQQLTRGEILSVNPTGILELLHAQDVAKSIIKAIEEEHDGTLRLNGAQISVFDVAEKLTKMYEDYVNDLIPDLRNTLDLQLFNTLRSFLYPKYYPKSLIQHCDRRGTLFEAVKSLNGGQTFLSYTNPGITRGDHFHLKKFERFLVLHGEAIIRIRRLFDSHTDEFYVSGSSPSFIDIPTLHTHNITNVGNEKLLTLFWSNEIFNPEIPDTFFEPVSLNNF